MMTINQIALLVLFIAVLAAVLFMVTGVLSPGGEQTVSYGDMILCCSKFRLNDCNMGDTWCNEENTMKDVAEKLELSDDQINEACNCG